MADAVHEEGFVKINVREQVDLVQQNDIRLFKGQGIFVRLVAAVGDADLQQLDVLPYGKFRRAHQVPYVFNKQDARFVKLQRVDGGRRRC